MKRKSNPPPEASPPAAFSWIDLPLVLLSSTAIFVYAHLPALSSPWVINDDVRQQIFWMQQWVDPQLFPGDLLAGYARAYVSWGVKGLYWLASPLMDPLNFSKWLPGLLFVFLGWCFFRLGSCLGSRRVGWFALGVYWLMPFFLDNLAGGLARAFAAPLLAYFCLCWLEARPWGLGLALLLQALFIPYIFLVTAGATLLAWLAGRTGKVSSPPFLNWGHIFLVALGAGLVLLMDHQFQTAGYGPLVSATDMVNHPEYTSQGRYPILPMASFFWELVSPWQDIPPFREGGIIIGALGAALVLGLAFYGSVRVRWQDLKSRVQPFGYLLLSSALLYFLARVFLMKLFVPGRYLEYTLNLIYCLGLALCLETALRPRLWPRGGAAAALLIVVVLSGLRLQGVGLFDYAAYQPLYAALAQTPKAALIAGHPNLMDNVPTFAKRRALATFELAHPWSKGYWQQVKPRLEDLFTAYYAEDPQVVRDFCRKYKISFLVVDDRHFSPEFLAGGRFLIPFDQPLQKDKHKMVEWVDCPFFAPFDGLIRSQVQGRRRFILLNNEVFPAKVLDVHQRLLDMRSVLHQDPPSPGS